MNTPFNFDENLQERLVYVKPVAVTDLPEQLQDQAGDLEQIYAVHGPDGERLALVANRGLAFEIARQHDLAPVNVH